MNLDDTGIPSSLNDHVPRRYQMAQLIYSTSICAYPAAAVNNSTCGLPDRRPTSCGLIDVSGGSHVCVASLFPGPCERTMQVVLQAASGMPAAIARRYTYT